MADLLGVPAGMLAEVLPSGAEFGRTAGGEGIPTGIAVHAVMGDQQAALFGQGCVAAGQAKNTYGSGCFVLTNIGAQRVDSRAGLLTTLACDGAGRVCYALEGSVFIGGAVVQWLRDSLGVIGSAAEVEALAASVPDTARVQFVPAFVGLRAPYWDAGARGAILGLTRGATRAHIARAALEAIAQQCTDVLEAMEREGTTIEMLKVDGGASANGLLMEMQADLSRGDGGAGATGGDDGSGRRVPGRPGSRAVGSSLEPEPAGGSDILAGHQPARAAGPTGSVERGSGAHEELGRGADRRNGGGRPRAGIAGRCEGCQRRNRMRRYRWNLTATAIKGPV